MTDLFHVITGIVALLTPWVMYLLKNQRDCIQDMEKRLQDLATKCAILQHETKNINEVLSALSSKLDDLNDKLGEVMSFKPLLEEALGSLREMRRSPRP